ncbi:gag-pro-pol [Symbiodinium sp. CCMP2592]|nr:gag-pro-pol [Symbiodinium sp. CCMP2592]
MFRRVQTIEYAHSERARELEAKSVGGKLSLEEQHTFGSLVRQAGTLMIAPSLLDHVKQEVENREGCPIVKESSEGAGRTRHQELPFPLGTNVVCPGTFFLCRRVKRRLERNWHRASLAALAHIRNSVHLLGAPEEALCRREALRQLQALDGYGEDQTPPLVASYEPSLLSLPTGEVPPVPLHELLGGDGMKVVEDFVSTRLLHRNDALRNLHGTGLADGGRMVEITDMEPQEKVEVFFVRKKDGRLRMVVDCRRSNEWFAAPDKVNLATAEVLSRIDLGGVEGELYIATADLKDAFYHFELPSELRPYFGMRTVSAGDLGINMIGGRPVKSTTLLHPRLKVLPMGWSHALWWCQTIHQRIVSQVGATASRSLEDRAAVPAPQCMHLEYVGNFVCLGTSKAEVETLAAAGVQALRDRGLVVHEDESAQGNINVLGWSFEGKKLRPLPHRVWQLEKVIGHATFIALGRREALSVFGECYSFIRTHYLSSHRIWPSVRRELNIWIAIAPLLWRDLGTPWAPEVTAVDASTWGLGAVVAQFSDEEVQQLGKYSERWRFEIPEYSCPRASVLEPASGDEPDEVRSYQWAHARSESYKVRPVPMSVVEGKLLSEKFKPVGAGAVDRKWKVVGPYKWKRQEGMPVLEGMVVHKHIPMPKVGARTPKAGKPRPTSKTSPKAQTQAQARTKIREEFGTLAEASVSRACRDSYSKLWRRVCTSAGLQVTEKYAAMDLDLPVSQTLGDMFDEGEDLSQDQYLVAAVQFYQPHLRKFEELAEGWIWQGSRWLGGGGWPGEVLKLHVRDLVPPAGSTHVWSLILHPVERETPSKTGEFDETILFDLPDIQWVAEQCFRLLKLGNPCKGVWPALSVPPSKWPKTRVYIEIFAGSGALGATLWQKCGGLVLLWDINLGADYDLRNPVQRQRICGWVRSGLVAGIHLGMPCESFSRARDVRPGPPPIRSNMHPLGLPGLRPADQLKVELGNLWMRFSVKVLSLCWHMRVPATLENPLTSRLWLCPPIQQLLRKPLVGQWTTHYCASGRPFKKPTSFVGVHVNLSFLAVHTCHSKRVCQYTGDRHVPLQGQTHSSGQWRTKWAEPYPPRMCRAIASAFYNSEVATMARRFEQCYARS